MSDKKDWIIIGIIIIVALAYFGHKFYKAGYFGGKYAATPVYDTSSGKSQKGHYVKGHTRKDGTYVKGHYRSH